MKLFSPAASPLLAAFADLLNGGSLALHDASYDPDADPIGFPSIISVVDFSDPAFGRPQGRRIVARPTTAGTALRDGTIRYGVAISRDGEALAEMTVRGMNEDDVALADIRLSRADVQAGAVINIESVEFRL